MPAMGIDTADAIELAELLAFIGDWLTADPDRLSQSLLAYIDHPGYGLEALHSDLDRFAFLLVGDDSEDVLGRRVRRRRL
jgi:hypothetical protein